MLGSLYHSKNTNWGDPTWPKHASGDPSGVTHSRVDSDNSFTVFGLDGTYIHIPV